MTQPKPSDLMGASDVPRWSKLQAAFDKLAQERFLGEAEEDLVPLQTNILRDVLEFVGRDNPNEGRVNILKDLCFEHVLYFKQRVGLEGVNADGLWRLFLQLQTQSPWPFEDCARMTALAVFDQSTYHMMDEEAPYSKIKGWIGLFVEWAKWTNAPLPMIAWAGVGAVAAAGGHRYFVTRGADPLRLGTYIMIFSGGRAVGKSYGMGAAKEILRRHNKILDQERLVHRDRTWGLVYEVPGDATYEGQVNMIADKEGAISQSFTRADGTAYHHEIDGSHVQFVDELVNYLGKHAYNVIQKIGYDIALYETGHYTKYTKKDGEKRINRGCKTFMGAAAPDWITQTLPTVVQQGGYLDRCQVIHRSQTPRKFHTPSPRDPLVAHQLAQMLTRLSCVEGMVEITWSKAAREFYEQWYNNLPKEFHSQDPISRVEAPHSANRAGNNLIRLAAILSLSTLENTYRIELDHIRLAAELLRLEDYYFTLWRRDLSTDDEAKRLLFVLRTLANSKDGSMGRADLWRTLEKSGQFGATRELNTARAVGNAIALALQTEYVKAKDQGNSRMTFVLQPSGFERLKYQEITWQVPEEPLGRVDEP